MSVNKEYAKAAAWFAGGAIIGAALGLLLAPQPGAETRRTIWRYATRGQVGVGRFGRDVKDKMDTKKDDTIKAA